VIRQRSPIPDRRVLLKIGIAGPLAGLTFAVPVAIIGLRLSQAVPLSDLVDMPSLQLGDSILFSLLARLFVSVPHGHELLLHPVAFAGWAGILVTGINLMPVGQLDGGHISYSVLGDRHKWVARSMFLLLFPLTFRFFGWWVWIPLLLFLIGIQHPKPLDDITSLNRREEALGLSGFALFILTFTPIPFQSPWLSSSQ
jgi:membrane-associated protease RseP (regulator of RpoE activity)